jgi:hypothetical protein
MLISFSKATLTLSINVIICIHLLDYSNAAVQGGFRNLAVKVFKEIALNSFNIN